MVSTILKSPMRKPSREPFIACGAALMFSWPPAMMMLASPHLMAWAAKWVAFRPLPDFIDGVGRDAVRQAGLDDGLARRVLADGGGQHLAEDGFADGGGVDAGLRDQALDDVGAQFGRGYLGQTAAEFADRGAGRCNDHYFFHLFLQNAGHGRLGYHTNFRRALLAVSEQKNEQPSQHTHQTASTACVALCVALCVD